MGISRRDLLALAPVPVVGLQRAGSAVSARGRARARELGLRLGRLAPGPWNAITDVPGVEVGHTTLIQGTGKLVVGQGPVRTGVTAVWPARDIAARLVPAGFAVPNGNGELTGLAQLRGLGVLASPVCLTGTASVGVAYDSLLALLPDADALVPVVGETWDGFLNDTAGRHVGFEHVRAALDAARSGPVAEGSVGGGTGSICYDFKGGIGTASRRLAAPLEPYMLGVLVQANHGWGAREYLRIDGVPVGAQITAGMPVPATGAALNSILMLLATDAPLLPHQLDRVARRAVHGLARTGGISWNGSGDFALAFSTGNRIARNAFRQGEPLALLSIDQRDLDPLFEAAAEAVEEAIVNALFMAEDMEGRDGHRVSALPLGRTLEILQRHGRLAAGRADG